MYKITFKLDETLTQWLIKIEQHEGYNNKPYRNKDGKEWKRLTRITNDELDKLRPKFIFKMQTTKLFLWQ